MAEIAPAGGGPNRLFIVLAIGLAALLVIGLIGLGGFFVVQNAFRPAVAPTVRVAQVSPTRPAAATEPTVAPTLAATPTLVLSGGGAVPIAQTGATSTPAPTPTSSTGELPQSGLGENLLLLAGGVVLVMIIFVTRRARTA